LAGALPKITTENIDFEYVESSLLEQTISSILLDINTNNNSKETTRFIMLSSIHAGEGKSWYALRLASKLCEISGRVLLLYPKLGDQENYKTSSTPLVLEGYVPQNNFVELEEIAALNNYNVNLYDYKYVIIEIPPLLEHQMPVKLIDKMDLSLLVVDAERSWKEADKYIIRLYQKASIKPPLLLLNKVSADKLENIFGEIPKKRNWLRKSVKKLLSPTYKRKNQSTYA
jgi:hypothetical protein